MFQKIIKGILNHPLNKKNKLRALIKFFYWQIISRFLVKKIVYNFIGNVKFYALRGMTGITGNIYCGLHEFVEMSFLIHFTREGDRFMDIGANVGSYTLLGAGHKKARTMSFEPHPITYKHLIDNIKLNNLDSLVETQNCALGKEEGITQFSSSLDTENHIIKTPNQADESIEVPVKVLNSFSSFRPNLIKLDVEGFETDVINGGTEIFSDKGLKVVIIELNSSGDKFGFSDSNIHKQMLAFGFICCSYNPFTRKVSLLNSFVFGNNIYVRNESLKFVRDRINSSEKIKINNTTY